MEHQLPGEPLPASSAPATKIGQHSRALVGAAGPVARIRRRIELGGPDRLRGLDQRTITPPLEIDRDLAQRPLDARGERPHRRLVVGAAGRQILPPDRLAADRYGFRAEDALVAQVDADWDQRKDSPMAFPAAQGNAGRAGFQLGQRRLAVTDPLGKDADRGVASQLLEHRLEHRDVELGGALCLAPPIHGNGAGRPHEPADPRMGEERRLGQEADRAASGGGHQRGIEQGVGMVGEDQ